VIQQLTEIGVVWLETLNGKVLEGMVNGSRLNSIETTDILRSNLGYVKKKGCSSTKVLELA